MQKENHDDADDDDGDDFWISIFSGPMILGPVFESRSNRDSRKHAKAHTLYSILKYLKKVDMSGPLGPVT